MWLGGSDDDGFEEENGADRGSALSLDGPAGLFLLDVYVAVSLVALLVPRYGRAASIVALVPEVAGEGSIMLWLLIKGVSPRYP